MYLSTRGPAVSPTDPPLQSYRLQCHYIVHRYEKLGLPGIVLDEGGSWS